MSDTGSSATSSGISRSGIVRLAVVVAVAVVGFTGALLLLGGDGDDPAPVADTHSDAEHAADSEDAEDAAEASAPSLDYDVTVEMAPDPPHAEGTAFTVLVSDDGEPVSGAAVLVEADMVGHAHEGISAEATEVEPGRYQTDEQRFPMRGEWAGEVRVSEDGGSRVSTPVDFTVQ